MKGKCDPTLWWLRVFVLFFNTNNRFIVFILYIWNTRLQIMPLYRSIVHASHLRPSDLPDTENWRGQFGIERSRRRETEVANGRWLLLKQGEKKREISHGLPNQLLFVDYIMPSAQDVIALEWTLHSTLFSRHSSNYRLPRSFTAA